METESTFVVARDWEVRGRKGAQWVRGSVKGDADVVELAVMVPGLHDVLESSGQYSFRGGSAVRDVIYTSINCALLRLYFQAGSWPALNLWYSSGLTSLSTG